MRAARLRGAAATPIVGIQNPASTMTGGSSVGDWAQFDHGLSPMHSRSPLVSHEQEPVLERCRIVGFRTGVDDDRRIVGGDWAQFDLV